MITLKISLIFLICIWSLDVSVCNATDPPVAPVPDKPENSTGSPPAPGPVSSNEAGNSTGSPPAPGPVSSNEAENSTGSPPAPGPVSSNEPENSTGSPPAPGPVSSYKPHKFLISPAQPAGVPTIFAKQVDLKQQATYFNSLISQHKLDQMAIDLAKLTCEQRMQVKVEYTNAYSRSIEQDIDGKTKKTFMRLLYALIQPMPELMAATIDWSITQKQDFLYVSLICTTPADLLTQIANTYAAKNNKKLVDAIMQNMKDVDGQDFLSDIVNAVTGFESMVQTRPNNTISEDLIQTQVNYIPQAQGNCSEKDNPDLYKFMGGASFAQIAAVVKAFQQKTSLSAASQIRQFCNGILSEAYSRIVIFAEDPVSYWTTEVYNSMGYGKTIDRGLTVAVLYRSEIDLASIRDSFKTTYHNDLVDFIKSHCSETYEKVMENIVSGVQE
ncbi:annexin A4 isoform X2 [Nilaparvata lugens]|uniref:annexin A4 isoform X2 n=1 Tax=Nilaparvata lugens TaxID=108931 RepID=UPI00193EBCE7|nr:annexin A4 isoform X2 [Nilaparvata lugens]